MVMARNHCARAPISNHDSRPEQSGNKTADVKAIVDDPNTPAKRPVAVIPPFVPGGTTRRFGEVMRRGLDLERIPSSEEKVSAATAA